ncbi:hypothetical protein NUSPORA_00239 [Nucleospora cyclopteri]
MLDSRTSQTKRVEITPMVLLSAVDHYKRQSYQRVLGILLGNITETKIVVTNSFAVPFEENDDGFFLDTSYLTNMHELFHKVNNKEKIVGFYHTGPKMYKTDVDISKTIELFCDNPILAIINVHLNSEDIPVQAFKLNHKEQFENLNVKIGADENEEVGVEHLLRDIKETCGSTLKDRLNVIKSSIIMYEQALSNIIQYLGKKHLNTNILKLLQEICNDIPRMTKGIEFKEIYNAELTNTVVALNDLIRNKMDKK